MWCDVTSSKKLRLSILLHLAMLLVRTPLAQEVKADDQSRIKSDPLQPLPQFEVVSIREDKSDDPARSQLKSDRYSMSNFTPLMIISKAFGVPGDLISGLPSWAKESTYRVDATLDESSANTLQRLQPAERAAKIEQMLQAVLIDRFGLVIDRVVQERPILELLVGKNGPKFQAAKANTSPVPQKKEGDPITGAGTTRMTPGEFVGQEIPMSSLVTMLQLISRLPIIDKTGLTGRYDIKFDWDRTQNIESTMSAEPQDSGGASIYNALQDQLGLRLRNAKGSVTTIVIRKISKPSEN